MSRSSTTSIRSRRWFLKQGLWLPVAPAILHAANWGGFKDPFGAVNQPAAAGGGGGPTFIFQENFEDGSVGFDSNNANSWTNSGACNPKYTTAPAPLAGTQSLSMPADEYVWKDFTSANEVWFYCLFNGATMRASGANQILSIRNGGTYDVYFNVDHDNSDRLQIVCGTSNARTDAGITAGVTYRLWGHYKLGTGANAVADIEWQDTSTARVGSGTHYKQLTDGSSTLAATRTYLHNSGSTDLHIIDTVKFTLVDYYTP